MELGKGRVLRRLEVVFRCGPGQQTARICLVHLGMPWHKGCYELPGARRAFFCLPSVECYSLKLFGFVYSYALIISQQGLWELSVLGILPVRFFPAFLWNASAILSVTLGVVQRAQRDSPSCCSEGFPALNLKNSSGPKETSLKCFCLKTQAWPGLYMSPIEKSFAAYF